MLLAITRGMKRIILLLGISSSLMFGCNGPSPDAEEPAYTSSPSLPVTQTTVVNTEPDNTVDTAPVEEDKNCVRIDQEIKFSGGDISWQGIALSSIRLDNAFLSAGAIPALSSNDQDSYSRPGVYGQIIPGKTMVELPPVGGLQIGGTYPEGVFKIQIYVLTSIYGHTSVFVSGTLNISAAKQALILSQNNSPVCITNMAISGYTYQTVPNNPFMGRVYLYLSGAKDRIEYVSLN